MTVLEGFPWLMPRQLNKTAGERLQNFVEKLGVSMRLSARIKEITGSDRAEGVLLEDGAVYPADLVVLSAGVRSTTHLARRAGLETANGVVVNNHLATSNADILAVGDMAEHAGVVYGLWGPAMYQGGIAGMNAAGETVEFGGLPRSNTLKVLGLDLFSIGKIEPDDGSYTIIEEDSESRLLRFMFHDNKLVGAILLGDASAAAGVKKAVESGADLSEILMRRPDAGEIMNSLKS